MLHQAVREDNDNGWFLPRATTRTIIAAIGPDPISAGRICGKSSAGRRAGQRLQPARAAKTMNFEGRMLSRGVPEDHSEQGIALRVCKIVIHDWLRLSHGGTATVPSSTAECR